MNHFRDPFDRLYEARQADTLAFGNNWCGPEKFKHGEKTVVARYPKPDGSDGQPVTVTITALPARFVQLYAEESTNSCGDPKPAYTVGFGTGCERLAADIAKEISAGMLTFRAGVPRGVEMLIIDEAPIMAPPDVAAALANLITKD